MVAPHRGKHMANARSAVLAVGFCLLLSCAPAAAGDSAGPDGPAAVKRLAERLAGAKSIVCEIVLDVTEGPDAAEQGRKHPILSGKTRYEFRVKGASRVLWREWRGGADAAPAREGFYEGLAYAVREGTDGEFRSFSVGEGEGRCVVMNLLAGGVLGWRLVHGIDNETDGSAYLAAMRWDDAGRKTIDGRSAPGVEIGLGFGFGPERPTREAGMARLWLDAETGLPIRREIDLRLPGGDARFRAVETFTDFRIDVPIPDSEFHVEGMPEPDALVDAPTDPAEFERVQTERWLGFAPAAFEGPKVDLPADAAPVEFVVEERKATGEDPRGWFSGRPRVRAAGPDGVRLLAVCDREPPKLAPGARTWPSDRTNRRHDHAAGQISPADVWIGRETPEGFVPVLFFRDVGSHASAPHAFAFDSKGRCHLVVADVDVAQKNRLVLLWLVGDPATGKWIEATEIVRRSSFTSWAHPYLATRGDELHLVWSEVVQGDPADSGIYHLVRTPDGFGPKTRIHAGPSDGFDRALHPETGRLAVAFSDRAGVSVAVRDPDGTWGAPVRVLEEAGERPVSIEPAPDGAFVLRPREDPKEWLLR